VYVLEPETGPGQGAVRIGHLGVTRDQPDYPAVELLGQILGSSFLNSRIPRVVRGEYGLAYSVGAYFLGGNHGPGIPGVFVAKCQTRHPTLVFAAQLMLREIQRIREEAVSQEELGRARASRIHQLRSIFATPGSTVRAFGHLELDGLPPDFYDGWQARYEGVTVQDVSRVAREYLRPEALVILLVGSWDAMKHGAGPEEPAQDGIEAMASMFGGRTVADLARLFGDGTVHRLPPGAPPSKDVRF
jgi:zinc protease